MHEEIQKLVGDDKELLYDVKGMLQNNIPNEKIINDLKAGKKDWGMCVFEEFNIKRELDNIRDTRPAKVTEGVYKCNKCKGKKIMMRSAQLRGGDEPMTNFFTCVGCGKRWKS